MRRCVAAVFLFALASGSASAAPFIFYRGVLNAASFVPQGLPHGSIARGSIFSIFGRDLGPAVGVFVSAFPLQNNLAGVSIEVCQNGACSSAIPLFVRADQINAIMPSAAPLGPVSVRVTYEGEAGNFSPANVVASSVGVFAANSGGFGPGIVQNFNAPDDQPLNSLTTAVRPGQFVTLWATGLGAALNGVDNARPQVGDLPVEVEIFVGGVQVTNRLYSGRSGEFAGLDQVVFEVPAATPAGCYVPVVLRTAGQVVSNSVTIAIAPNGGACSDPMNPLDAARPGGRIGIVLLTRMQTTAELPLGMMLDFSTDLVGGIFQQEPQSPWHFNRLYSLPPPGSCSAFSAAGGEQRTDLLANLVANGPSLSAGEEITASGPSGELAASSLPFARNFYGALGGTGLDLLEALALIFNGGAVYSVSGPGGQDVGAFQVDLEPAAGIDWTNREAFEAVNRGQALEFTWTGGEAEGLVVAVALSQDSLNQVSAGFMCVERAAAGRVTASGRVTSNLAAGGSDGDPNALIVLTSLPAQASPYAASGLEVGLGVFVRAEAQGAGVR